MEVEILQVTPASERADGVHYVRYAGWRDETRKSKGQGQPFRRPDGGVIAADLMNDHKLVIPSKALAIFRRPADGLVFNEQRNEWIDLRTYTGSHAELRRVSRPVDVEREYVRPAIERFAARTHRINKWGDRTGTTLNLQVGASSDDGIERRSDGVVASIQGFWRCFSNTTLSSAFDGLCRFTSVTVPKGATIDAADCTLLMNDITQDDADLSIFCEDTDDAATMGSGTNDLTNRTRTTASTAWVQSSIGLISVTTPDIASAVQEVVDRAGWASGNALAVYFRARTDLIAELEVVSYDASTIDAAKLDIDYTQNATFSATALSAATSLPGTPSTSSRTIQVSY